MSTQDFTLDATDMPFMLFAGGGTSLARVEGLHDNGKACSDDLVGFHFDGRWFLKGDEQPGERSLLVGLRIEDAEQFLTNLTQTIADYKEKNGG